MIKEAAIRDWIMYLNSLVAKAGLIYSNRL